MASRKTSVSLIIILVIAFIAFAIVFPFTLNRGIDFMNRNVTGIVGIKIPNVPAVPFKLGLDLQGGSDLVYLADLSKIKKDQGEKMDRLKAIIEKRIQGRGSHGLGVSEPLVTVERAGRTYRLVVDLPGVRDIDQAIKLIGETPYLEFRKERSAEDRKSIITKHLGDKASSVDPKTACSDARFVAGFITQFGVDPCYQPTNLTGEFLEGASMQFSEGGIKPYVSLAFNHDGASVFAKITAENVGKILGVYIDGQPISLPVVREAISGGKAQITGDFTIKEAKELAGNLNLGALPIPIKLISQTTIGPTLGSISLSRSLKAAVYGFIAIALFMIFVYRLPGLMAFLSLIIYGGILLSIFKIIPVTLTLAGIGGAVLSIGMAVDANVLIFERQKEEMANQESFSRMVNIGFSRAWPSIRDSNFTTLLVALIMFLFGTSFVKGFATTLSLGILVSLFSALFVTEVFMKSFIGTKLEKVKWLWSETRKNREY